MACLRYSPGTDPTNIAKILLEAGCQMYAEKDVRYSALHAAAQNDDAQASVFHLLCDPR